MFFYQKIKKIRKLQLNGVGMDFHSTPLGHPRDNTCYITMEPTPSDANSWNPSNSTRKPRALDRANLEVGWH